MALIRIRSPVWNTGSYRGPILFNPGGPGQSGVAFIRQAGSLLRQIVGPNYDLVGFDPRGAIYTSPARL